MCVLAFQFSACGDPRGTDEAGSFRIPPPVASGERATFAELKTGLLGPQCARCHEEAETEQGFHEWVAVAPVLEMVESGRMPPRGPRVQESTRELLRRYIANLQTAPEPVSP
jgi:hypothetical protein